MRFPRLGVNDDSGHCRVCGEHLDTGRCDCNPCEMGRCDHVSHCDICGVGIGYVADYCVGCEIETAPRQLTSSALDRNQISQGATASGADALLRKSDDEVVSLVAVLKQLNQHFGIK